MGRQTSQPATPAPEHSLLRNVTLASLYLAILTSVLTAVAGYFIASKLLEQRALTQLSIIASGRKDVVERALQFDRERTSLFAARPDIRAAAVNVASAERAASTVLSELHNDGPLALGVAFFDRNNKRIAYAGTAVVPSSPQRVTHVEPDFLNGRWIGYSVYSPLPDGAMFAIRYSAEALAPVLFDISALGISGQVLLAARGDGNMPVIIHQRNHLPSAEEISLHNAITRFAGTEAVAQALLGAEGIHRAESQTQGDVYVAYRTLPTLGWGLAASVRRGEALRGLDVLSGALAGINAFLLGSATILSVLLARRVTRGLRDLAGKVQGLRPGNWDYRRTVVSKDEVELLDSVVADLTHRLRDSFGALEEEISARTEELRIQSAQDRAILETIEQGIMLFDAKGRITAVNPAAAQLIGTKPDALLGKSITASLPFQTHRRALTGSAHPIERCLETHQRFHQRADMHLCIVCKDGTLLPVFLVVSALVEKGKCTGGIAVFQDVTEERQIDYMKSEFISLASHQLRTPLSALLWYIELLEGTKSTRLNKEQLSYVREMQTAAERMSGLVDALLQVSRLEGGGIRPSKQSIDLGGYLQEIAEESKHLAKDRHVALSLRVPLRPVRLHTDPTLLSIVLQNIISNAVKYSRTGSEVTIVLQSLKTSMNILIEDSGIGIPEKEQQHLFQKLFRAGNVRKVDATGSGLGLYISRMVMETLGGSISLKSRENKGTVVTVRLPKRSRR